MSDQFNSTPSDQDPWMAGYHDPDQIPPGDIPESARRFDPTRRAKIAMAVGALLAVSVSAAAFGLLSNSGNHKATSEVRHRPAATALPDHTFTENRPANTTSIAPPESVASQWAQAASAVNDELHGTHNWRKDTLIVDALTGRIRTAATLALQASEGFALASKHDDLPSGDGYIMPPSHEISDPLIAAQLHDGLAGVPHSNAANTAVVIIGSEASLDVAAVNEHRDITHQQRYSA
jgi:hypothetical protein